jgi:peptidoglycan L-alanyl-D-glutamate endopeptidase CwlK
MSRSLTDLSPKYVLRFAHWLDACKAQGLELLVTSTLRTKEEQDALYAIGRTKPGKRVTNAKAGQSAHNFGFALDFVPLVHGKPEWTGKHPDWSRAGKLAASYGLEWAGGWTKFKELAHVQIPGWKGLVQ